MRYQGDWGGVLPKNNMLVVNRGSPTYLGTVNRYQRGSKAPASERSRPIDLEETIVFDALGDIDGMFDFLKPKKGSNPVASAVQSVNPLQSMFSAPKMIAIGAVVGLVIGGVVGFKIGRG